MATLIVDVREPAEFTKGHVSGAVNITAGEIMRGAKQLESVAKDTQIVLYCRTGSRSGMAKVALGLQGFVNVINGGDQRRVEGLLGQENGGQR